MLVLLEIARKVEDRMRSMLYDFAQEEDRNRFTRDTKRDIDPYAPTQIASGSVYFDANQWEQERNIVHCYLAIVYNGLFKRGILEIDINKRVAAGGTTS